MLNEFAANLKGDAEYRGGFLDDGLILSIDRRKDPRNSGHFFYAASAIINSANLEVLETFSRYNPGNIYPRREKSEIIGWSWTIKKAIDLYEFLEKVEPDLRLVKPQAGAILDLLNEKNVVRKALKKPYSELSPEERMEQEAELYMRFQEAKKEPVEDIFVPSFPRLAGIIDHGSGSMGIYRIPRPSIPLTGYEDRGCFELMSPHTGLIDGLRKMYASKRAESGLGHNQIQLQGPPTLKLLTDIRGFSVLRREEIDLVIEFLEKYTETSESRRKRSKEANSSRKHPDFVSLTAKPYNDYMARKIRSSSVTG